jgi:ABC-type sugar transport system ATPase subunit
MAEITLEHVSVTYHRGNTGGLPLEAQARRGRAPSTDRAFTERVIAARSSSPSTWEPVTALNDLNLVIPDGEALAIVGPSGCGKSTLLKVIAGLEPIDSGRVLFDGRDMAGIKPGERGIGMVFQSYALYPHMKGEGNLGFFFRIHRRPSEEMMERIRITSEIMGIGFEQLLGRSPRTLSGGQQQRVAIGRCIVRDPGLFLFDEPLSNLDAKLRSQTRVEIKRLLRRFAITAAYVTHDQSEAIALGDRIAIMRAGRIEQVGTYQELCALPANHFVAGFLGLSPMNLIDGYLSSATGAFTGPLGDIRIPEARQHPIAAGKRAGARLPR